MTRWHQIGLACPKCNRPAQILSIAAAADGELLVENVCIACNLQFIWKSDFARLIRDSSLLDAKEDRDKAEQKLVEAVDRQIAKICNPPGLTIKDRQLLHSFGISADDPKQLPQTSP